MGIMVKMKSMLLAVSVFGNLSLCGMELQKFDGLKNALFFVQKMRDSGAISHDVATVIVHKSSLLVRMDTIYEKFDSFFHFKSDIYGKTLPDSVVKRHKMSQEVRKNGRYGAAADVKKLNKLADFDFHQKSNVLEPHQMYRDSLVLTKIDSDCYRKFSALEPHHLLFLTEEYDGILLSLITKPGCFYYQKGVCEINLCKEDYDDIYLLLPPVLRAILDGYIKDLIPDLFSF